MRHGFRFGMIAAVLAALFCAPAIAADEPNGAAKALTAQPHDDFPGGVIRLRDMPYRVLIGYHPITADIYVPTQGSGPYPAVVYGHGGGWANGSPRNPGTPENMAALAARGYVVMAINYRFYHEAKFPGPVQDAKAALRWIRSNAALYGVDTKHVAYWGVSAGGYLGAELGTSCGVKALEPEPEGKPSPDSGTAAIITDPTQSDCADAVALWFTPIDFPKMDAQALPNSLKHGTPDSSESQLMGCALDTCPKALLAAANPTTYINAKNPPFLLMHGDNDHRVPLQQSKDFYAALKAKGVDAQLIVVPGADHIWVGATPEQKKQILQTTFDFLDRTLKH